MGDKQPPWHLQTALMITLGRRSLSTSSIYSHGHIVLSFNSTSLLWIREPDGQDVVSETAVWLKCGSNDGWSKAATGWSSARRSWRGGSWQMLTSRLTGVDCTVPSRQMGRRQTTNASGDVRMLCAIVMLSRDNDDIFFLNAVSTSEGVWRCLAGVLIIIIF